MEKQTSFRLTFQATKQMQTCARWQSMLDGIKPQRLLQRLTLEFTLAVTAQVRLR
jgi:hypothetical protein